MESKTFPTSKFTRLCQARAASLKIAPMSWDKAVPNLQPLIILKAIPSIFSSRVLSSLFPVTQKLRELSNITRAEQRGRIFCNWIGAFPNMQDTGSVMRVLRAAPERRNCGVG